MTYTTEQEAFWAGSFGEDYTARNSDASKWVPSNVSFFAQVLRHTETIGSVVELGANLGLNLKALRELLPTARLEAVEINSRACQALKEVADTVHETSLLGFTPDEPSDLAFTKGVLIHVNPDALPAAYQALVRSSRRYVLVAEYYNPSPIEVSYRGHSGRLFKRDFAGELMDLHKLRLLHYGFVWHRDTFPQDDLTWFLMEKP